MNALEAGVATTQREAIACDPAGGALAIVGPPASGKSFALVRRALRLARADGGRTVVLAAPSDAGVRRLRARIAAESATYANLEIRSFGDVAFELLAQARAPDAPPLRAIDDVAASRQFEEIGAALFALDWTEFVSDEIDPEITGLRAPERFSAAAFRLIRKLRGSLVSPEEFRLLGLQGATKFYGQPPNFASPDVLLETQPKYRDSLRADAAELARQHAREVDLVKILARLYASYRDAIVASGTLTPIDAVYEATMLLRARPALAARARATYAACLVDDAQDLATAQGGLIEAIFGTAFDNVTLAGDAAQSTRGFATGARGAELFKRAAVSIELPPGAAMEPAIARAARLAADPQAHDAGLPAGATRAAVQLYRATTQRDETHFVASEVARAIAAGCAPERIAVIVRGLPCAHGFIDALLARDIPVDVGGAASLYEYPAVADALAALWAAIDPFRHDWLLRNLEAPWLRLSDASIATLCGDAAEPQPLLFALPDDDVDEARTGRWDRRRDLRLGRNVTRGDVDLDLPDEARARLGTFRAARERWAAAARSCGLATHARLILAETALATAAPAARGRFETLLIARLLDEIDRFAAADPLATLEAFLLTAEHTARAEADLLAIDVRDERAVRVLDVEAAKGETFDIAFVVDARAGAWPRYYVPDAFLFVPGRGMIPKDNVGDTQAARTAKFTYLWAQLKFRDKYNAEERRAFYVAATRARARLYVSASGRPTRGVAAPELLAELEKHV